jgi:hypothetical protein
LFTKHLQQEEGETNGASMQRTTRGGRRNHKLTLNDGHSGYDVSCRRTMAEAAAVQEAMRPLPMADDSRTHATRAIRTRCRTQTTEHPPSPSFASPPRPRALGECPAQSRVPRSPSLYCSSFRSLLFFLDGLLLRVSRPSSASQSGVECTDPLPESLEFESLFVSLRTCLIRAVEAHRASRYE